MCLSALPGVLRAQDVIYSGSSTTGNGSVINTTTGVTLNENISGTLAIVNNHSDGNGGAIYSGAASVTTLVTGNIGMDVLISGNSAGGQGGAFYDTSNPVTLSPAAGGALIISNNRANNGGGAFFADKEMVTINASAGSAITVLSNTTTSGDGGGFYSCGFTLNSVGSSLAFQNNYAGGSGGAIYANLGDVLVSGTYTNGIAITSNTAASGNGGAFSTNGGGIDFENVYTDVLTIADNHASANGGALYTGGTHITFSGRISEALHITGNTAGNNGGAFFVNKGNISFSADCVPNIYVTNNTAGNQGGAFFGAEGFNLHLGDGVNFTAYNNKANGSGGNTGGFVFANGGTVSFDIGVGGTATIGNASSIANQADSIGGWSIPLEKNGAGTLVLWGSNSYTGNTNLNAGKTLIHGSIYGDNAYQSTTVDNGAILGGNGSVFGNTTIQNGGTITANDIGSAGALTVSNLTLSSGANAVFDLASSALYDQLLVVSGGSIQLANGITITVNILDGFNYQEGQDYTFNIMQGVSDNHDYRDNISWNTDAQWAVKIDSATLVNGVLIFQVQSVPEPSAWLLLSIGALLLALHSLRRKPGLAVNGLKKD
jgi:fibronectin-binding autotransporter adhesin